MLFPPKNTSKEKIREVTLRELMTRNAANFANPTAFLVDSTNPTEAVLLQYFHKWISYKKKDVEGNRRYIHRGKMWLYATLTKIQEDTGLCRQTIVNTIKSLKAKNLLAVDKFNSKTYDRTKWYTLNYEETVILRLRFPQTYEKQKVMETFSNQLEEEMEAPIVYGVDYGQSTGQTKVSLPGRPTIPLILPLITPSYDESPLRGNSVASLRSATRPHGSDTLVMHQSNGEVIHKLTDCTPIQKGKRLLMTQDHHSGYGDVIKQMGSEERMAKAKEKLNLSGKVHVAQQFWLTLLSHYGVGGLLSFTAKETGMMKALLKQLIEVNIPPGEFLEFTVVNWDQIRRQLTWPDNPKKFRLAEKPFFQELIFNKNDIIRLWYSRGSLGGPIQPKKQEYTYTRLEDIPKTHPNYAKLVQQIEINGKAVTYIKA